MNTNEKGSDWKACNRQKRFGSSNLPHSAKKCPMSARLARDDKCIIQGQKTALGSKKTAKKPKMRKVRVSLYYRGVTDKHGTAPLLIAVNHASSSCYIPLQGVRLKPNQWDKQRKKVINHSQADTINSVAASTLGKANEAIMHIMAAGGVRGKTTAQVRDMVAAHLYPSDDVDVSVSAILAQYISRCERPNTADKFKQTQTHLARWLGAKGFARLQFADITPDFLHDFDKYLSASCPSIASRGIHLRNVRTIFNFAINRQLTTAVYPFRRYKIKSAPATPTPLALEQVRRLWSHQPQNDVQRYWLDLWRLIFCLIGINIADLSMLDKITQGRINYTRKKTGRNYSVKVEPVAANIIKAHKGRERLLDILDRYKDVHIATTACNKHLKAIAEDLGLPPITTYTARYTWASIAMQLDTPIEVISQALGHTYGQAVTLGYIVPDRRKVDEANRKVLAAVCTP